MKYLLNGIGGKNNPNKLHQVKNIEEVKKAASKAARRWNKMLPIMLKYVNGF